MLESVLFETDNYKGFRYLDILEDENGAFVLGENGYPVDFGDETRREYF